MRDLLDIFIYS